jgi:hypothetical protein
MEIEGAGEALVFAVPALLPELFPTLLLLIE